MKKLFFLFTVLFAAYFSLSAQGILDEMKNGKTQDSLLRLKITGNGYSDETIILFMGSSTECFDSNYDAYKLMGLMVAPQLYNYIWDTCTNQHVNMAVNVMPHIYVNKMVQLKIRVDTATEATEVYTIEATEHSFPAGNQIWMEDTQEDVWIDLLNGSPYNFIHATRYAERFRIWFFPTTPINLKANLEGAYDASAGEMTTTINGILPLNQPFSGAPWNYSGTESVSSIPSSNIVDWILVEFRDAAGAASATSATAFDYQAGFLLKDGSIVALDGTTPLQTQRFLENNLFTVLHTRNHLDVINAAAVPQVNGIYAYDFTTAANKAYGNTQAALGDGSYGLLGGDTNGDGTIDIDDISDQWNSETGTAGYLPSDVNYDGQSDNKDKNDVWLNNNGSSGSVPN